MKKYVQKLAIDFGSTVSTIGWQLFERENEEHIVPLKDTQTVFTLPTIMVERGKNPNLRLDHDLYGEKAYTFMRKNPGTVTTANFKLDFYDMSSKGHAEAHRATIKFFSFLREQFEHSQTLTNAQKTETDLEVWFTTPVMASTDGCKLLEQAADKAGFTPVRNYPKGCIHIVDEARCLADLAFSDTNNLLYKHLSQLALNPGSAELVLLVDIGGLTADICLASIRYDQNTNYRLEELSSWPPNGLSEDHLLGGIVLDKAIYNYLDGKGFINSEAARKLINAIGYSEYRQLKENANTIFWSVGKALDKLGAIGIDADKGLYAPHSYTKSPESHLSPQVFLQEVATPYIKGLSDAVKNVIKRATDSPQGQGLDVREENIDWVFLTGGGSSMFFMRDWLLGKMGMGESLHLAKLQKDPNRLISSRFNPTESTVRGALAYTGKLILHAKTAYYLDVTLVSRDVLSKTKKVMDFRRLQVVPDNGVFPCIYKGEYSFDTVYKASNISLQCRMSLVRGDSGKPVYSQSEEQNFSLSKTGTAIAKDVGNAVGKSAAWAAAGVVAFGLCVGALEVVELVGGAFPPLRGAAQAGILESQKRFSQKLEEYKYIKRESGKPSILDKMAQIDRTFTERVSVKYKFEADANGVLSIAVSVLSPSLFGEGKSQTYQL